MPNEQETKSASNTTNEDTRPFVPYGENTYSCVRFQKIGCKCAVGAIIPDDEYDPKMEHMGVRALIKDDSRFTSLSDVTKEEFRQNLGLLERMQMVHDCRNWAAWEQEFGYTAKEFNLQLPVSA